MRMEIQLSNGMDITCKYRAPTPDTHEYPGDPAEIEITHVNGIRVFDEVELSEELEIELYDKCNDAYTEGDFE